MRCVAAAAAAAAAAIGGVAAKPSYSYYRSGSKSDKATTPTPGLVLMGGGTDVDAAFQWMVQRSGGGDFLVIRADDDALYDDYVMGFGGSNSAGTLCLFDRSASEDADVLRRVDEAEAIFFAGGDQWTYVKQWNGTSLQRAVQRAVQRGAPVGGTSAGCAVLSAVVYTAEHDTVYSDEALADPYDPRVTLGGRFVGAGQAPRRDVADPHFVTRDRMGRLLAFMARAEQDGLVRGDVVGVGVDERTALAVAGGVATALGSGTAYVAVGGAAQTCSAGAALRYTDVPVTCLRAADGDQYDFNKLAAVGKSGSRYSLSAKGGKVSATDGGDVYCHDTMNATLLR